MVYHHNESFEEGVSDTDTGVNDERQAAIERDLNAVPEHDGRSDAPTGFNSNKKYLADTSEDHNGVENPTIVREGKYYKKWEWLNMLSDGYRTDGWKGQSNEANQRRFAETVMSDLGCTDYQQERVSHLLSEQDGRSHGGKHYEIVVMALISLVLEEDGRYVRDEQQWTELREDLVVDGTDVGKHDIKSVRFSLEDNDIMSDDQPTKSLQYKVRT